MTAHGENRREQNRGVIAIADADQEVGHKIGRHNDVDDGRSLLDYASDVVTIRRRYNGLPCMNAGAAPMEEMRWR